MIRAAERLRAEAAKRILVKDGAYGTEVQARRLKEAEYRGDLDLARDQKGNNDQLNLSRPALMREIALSFADAGAEILATNTFNANRISQADYGAEHLVREINLAAARITREVAAEAEARDGIARWVAGALGPTNKTLSLSPDVNDPGFREVDFDTMSDVYVEQIESLVEGGADILATHHFYSTRFSLADYYPEVLVRDINIEAARIIREAIEAASARDGVTRFVAGAIGPTNKTLSLSPDVNDPGFREIDWDTLVEVYREQAAALIEGGADFVLVETVFDTLNAKVAVFAVEKLFADLGRRHPVM
ncbi:MAG: homocysteine S-methyltransferase family protein, partial [Sphingomonadaceae bacterium]|nr:homocysteine S-methyltransferase family protein [Sphingomonadaceae bacterium]